MRLTIFSVSIVDYTTYKCVAKNPRGETDGSIRLYGKHFTQYYLFAHRPTSEQFYYLIINKIINKTVRYDFVWYLVS